MKKFICICLAAIIAISGIVGYFIWKNNQAPVYLPLDYMYAINLDNGGKVKPGMSREEVEKVFPQPKNGDVYFYDINEDDEKVYSYGGIDFVYNYDDILFRAEASYAYNKEQEKISRFNYEIGGLKFSDLGNISYEDVIEIFGKPTVDDRVRVTLAAEPRYFCYIEDDKIRVLTHREYKKINVDNVDKKRIFNINFYVNHDLKVDSVELDNYFYMLSF